MSRYIAFLRAINVGGSRTLKMDTLRQLFESIGLAKVETFIASGNVVFETTSRSPQALESKIENTLRAALGYEVATFIRTDAQVAAIAHYQPFRKSESDAGNVHVIFLAEPLDARCRQEVVGLSTDGDEFHVHEREIYWLRRKNSSGYNFAMPRLEKIIDQPFTIRGTSTLKKLAEKYCK